ncbi:MAG: YccF domain-containing protein [Rhodospirillales bacterium]|nr:YccF domain-containing protein [Rhodospirillales bacterium]
MSLLSVVLNVLWVLTGGLWMAIGWFIAAIVMALTIIGIPWARSAFTIARYAFLPFGFRAVPRNQVQGYDDLGTGAVGWVGNLFWLLLAGWWLAICHLVIAVGLAITIVGIPFAWAHLKFAGLSLWPVGKTIVSAERFEFLRIGSR